MPSGNLQVEQQLNNYAISFVQPGLRYYNDRLTRCMQPPLAAFKAAWLFSPLKVKETIPDCSAVDCLSAFPFLDGATLGNLKTELPQYIAAAEDVNWSYSPLEFWKVHEPSLSTWCAAAKKVLWFSHHQLHVNGFSRS